MAKEIVIGGWVSIVPNKMVQSWIKRKFITNAKILNFGETEIENEHGDIIYRLSLLDEEGWTKESKWVKTKKEIRDLKKLGYKNNKHAMIIIVSKYYNIMRQEVSKWYQEVFDYIEEWLFRNGLLHLEKGSLQTGFCVESDPNHEVVKDWGAPLAKENNKVVQMKEKWGEVRIYFCGLTKEENNKVKKFAKEVEKKFDCRADFC